MKKFNTPLIHLAHHLQCVSRIDHYSNFLLQHIKEGSAYSLTTANSSTFISLCVQKRSRDVTLTHCNERTSIDNDKELICIFPSYYKERIITDYESFFKNEVKIQKYDDEKSRILLIWIQQSFQYRYGQKNRKRVSVLKEMKSPSLIQKINYWGLFLFLSIKRRKF